MIEALFNWDSFFTFWNESSIIDKIISATLAAWILSTSKRILEWIAGSLKRKTVSVVYIDSTNEMYNAFSEWYMKKYPSKMRQTEVSVNHKYKNGERRPYMKVQQLDDSRIVRYKGVPILINKYRDVLDHAAHGENRYLDVYSLVTFMGGDILDEIVNEAFDSWNIKTEADMGLKLIVTDKWANSKTVNIFPYKTLDDVFIDNKDFIVEDIDNFLAKKRKYYDNGIKFKRSYLLHGKPGTGKSTLVMAIAHWLDRPVYYLNPSGFSSDQGFEEFVSEVDPESIILIEDIDIFWTDRDSESKTPVSFQSLLNVLDGLHSPNNVLIFMTTNRPDKFDDALFRKGRMDVKVEIDYPSKEQVEKYITNFYNRKNNIRLRSFSGNTPMVDIQDICVKNDLLNACKKIEKL